MYIYLKWLVYICREHSRLFPTSSPPSPLYPLSLHSLFLTAVLGVSSVRHQSTDEEELDNLPFSEMVLQLADKVAQEACSNYM